MSAQGWKNATFTEGCVGGEGFRDGERHGQSTTGISACNIVKLRESQAWPTGRKVAFLIHVAQYYN